MSVVVISVSVVVVSVSVVTVSHVKVCGLSPVGRHPSYPPVKTGT